MAKNSTEQVALDDAFISIFIEELSGDTASLSEADQSKSQTGDGTVATTVDMPQPEVVEQEQPASPQKPEAQPAPATSSSRWQLRVVQPDKKECILPLSENPISIGRKSKNSLVLSCERISQEHARIWLDKDGPRVEDLNSTNGTWVNGTKVPAAFLKAKDVVSIGQARIYVEQV